MNHPNDFSPFFINSRRIKIANFLIAFGTNRVRHRATVLRELCRTQGDHVINPFDRTRTGGSRGIKTLRHHVCGKFLISKNSEAFFEAKFEPVTASDTVACPVVKVLMPDHCFNRLIVRVGCGVWIGQHVGCIKDVEPLILHCTHIEIAGCHDHETIKIELKAEALFVPAQRALE